ncbi:MAG: hypothetical protein PHX51_04680 [Clostridia bacterium]|nr:hypothetical protein [Clostridia bacterium]
MSNYKNYFFHPETSRNGWYETNSRPLNSGAFIDKATEIVGGGSSIDRTYLAGANGTATYDGDTSNPSTLYESDSSIKASEASDTQYISGSYSGAETDSESRVTRSGQYTSGLTSESSAATGYQYTSGSTSESRGIMSGHSNFGLELEAETESESRVTRSGQYTSGSDARSNTNTLEKRTDNDTKKAKLYDIDEKEETSMEMSDTKKNANTEKITNKKTKTTENELNANKKGFTEINELNANKKGLTEKNDLKTNKKAKNELNAESANDKGSKSAVKNAKNGNEQASGKQADKENPKSSEGNESKEHADQGSDSEVDFNLSDKDKQANREWHDELQNYNKCENTKSVLCALEDNTSMAINSLERALPHAGDDLGEIIQTQINAYKATNDRIDALSSELGFTLKKQEGIKRIWVNAMVSMKTALTGSTGKLAEMLLKGTLMGIIDLRRLLIHTATIYPEVLELARQILTFEEQSIEIYKSYL